MVLKKMKQLTKPTDSAVNTHSAVRVWAKAGAALALALELGACATSPSSPSPSPSPSVVVVPVAPAAPTSAMDAPDRYGVSVQRQAPSQSDLQAPGEVLGAVQQAFFSPLALDCSNPLACPALGLSWSANKPKQALLQIGFVRGQHAPVTMVEFLARPHGPMRVRSQAPDAPQSPGSVTFQMPMASLERVMASPSVLLRVSTADGRVYEESLHSGEHTSAAFTALRRWMQQIYQGTDKEQALGLRGLFASPYVHNP